MQVFSGIGGVVNIFGFSLGTGLLGFAFWSTLIISGFLLIFHILNLAQTLEKAFPPFTKLVSRLVICHSLINY